MKVLKFGGTSVGTAASLANVKRIVESRDERVIVVVSALGGLTDKLISTARQASQGDVSYLQSYAQIVERHNDIINAMVPRSRRMYVEQITSSLIDQLNNIYNGVTMIKEPS